MRGIGPAVLCRQKLIVSVGRELRKLLSEWFETEEVKPIDLMEVSSFEQVRVAVLEGLGIGLLPGHVVEDELAAGRLLQLEIRNFEVSRESYVIFRKNISEPARLLVNKMIESGSSQGSPRGTESAATAGTV